MVKSRLNMAVLKDRGNLGVHSNRLIRGWHMKWRQVADQWASSCIPRRFWAGRGQELTWKSAFYAGLCRDTVRVGAGLPAKKPARYMAAASPVFAGKPGPTGTL
ncbi:hypothetical protein D3C80_1820680 [compost metagenome]